jgi:hypothetical protein
LTRNDEEEAEAIPSKPGKGCFGFFKGKENDDIIPMSHLNNDVVIENNVENVVQTPTIYKRAFFWICGIESQMKKQSKEEEEADKVNQAKLMHISIEETPFWSKFNKINAVFQLCLCAFLWVFFNKFN